MPNYVRNRLTIIGTIERPDVEEVFEFLKSDKSAIDFNKIIPMPESLNIESSSSGEQGVEYLLGKAQGKLYQTKFKELEQRLIDNNQLEEAIDLGKKYLMNVINTGYTTWYQWCINNWGTKWNAMQDSRTGNKLLFETAWSGVTNLIQTLSYEFPDILFDYAYADEDTGRNCGFGIIKNGEVFMETPDGGSRDAYDVAFSLWPDKKKYYKLENDNYVYIEDEEEEE